MTNEYWEKRVKIVAKYLDEMKALNEEFQMPDMDNVTREKAIGNNKCALCGEQATTKLYEGLFKDEIRHELNNYYCGNCFSGIMTPPQSPWLRQLVKERNYKKKMSEVFGDEKHFGFQVRGE